ncbi:MAG: hypothetical protein AAFY19_03780 [Pseudomonadota bacterium]
MPSIEVLSTAAICLALGAAPLAAHTQAPVQSSEAPATDSASVEPNIAPADLVGVWDVALYFSPSAPPSSTVMEIKAVNADGTIEGSFYSTEFEKARYTQRNGEIAFAMITRDGSGLYATSGRLQPDGSVKGQTFATGRDFVMIWTAERR